MMGTEAYDEQEAMKTTESTEAQQESEQAVVADVDGDTNNVEIPADTSDRTSDEATASAAVAAAAAAAPETSAVIESGHDSDGDSEQTDHHDGDGELSGSEGEATTKTRSWAEESERAFRQPRAHRRS